MKVLVTGANGMIGLATVRHFLEKGYQVAALVRNIGAATRIDPRAEIRVLDSDWSNLQDVCSGCDAVVHLAAQRLQPEYEERGIEAYWLPNVLLTEQL
ncbi:MAG: NAD(P)-dependent oxidoreductase, partial [candidate division KSB1 bacterium]|nr:NAD(P)-dependent oxidoreductase [candidate division KSB1 bacterium]